MDEKMEPMEKEKEWEIISSQCVNSDWIAAFLANENEECCECGMCKVKARLVKNDRVYIVSEQDLNPRVTRPDEGKTEPITETDKAKAIKDFVELTAKHTLTMFKMLDLKTHIECMVVNAPTNEEFIFSFKTVEKFKKDEGKEPVSDQEIEERTIILNNNQIQEAAYHIHPKGTAQQWRFLKLGMMYYRDVIAGQEKLPKSVIEAGAKWMRDKMGKG